MSCDGNNRAAMALAGREPVVKQPDMALAIGLEPDRAGGRFDEAHFRYWLTLWQVPPWRMRPPLAMMRGTSPA